MSDNQIEARTALNTPDNNTKKSIKNAALFGWKLVMSNAGAIVLSGSCFAYTIATGGMGWVMVAAVASLTAVITKYAIDFYVFKSEDKLQNTYDSLMTLRKTIIKYHNELQNHQELYNAIINKEEVISNSEYNPLPYNETLATINAMASISAGVLSVTNSAVGVATAANIISKGGIGISTVCLVAGGAFVISEHNRIAMKTSINAVNKLKRELCISTNDAKEIAKLNAELQTRIDVLKSPANQDLTLETFEAKLKNSREISDIKSQENAFKEKTILETANEALFDTFHHKKLQTQEVDSNPSTYNAFFKKAIVNTQSVVSKDQPPNVQQKQSFVERLCQSGSRAISDIKKTFSQKVTESQNVINHNIKQ